MPLSLISQWVFKLILNVQMAIWMVRKYINADLAFIINTWKCEVLSESNRRLCAARKWVKAVYAVRRFLNGCLCIKVKRCDVCQDWVYSLPNVTLWTQCLALRYCWALGIIWWTCCVVFCFEFQVVSETCRHLYDISCNVYMLV